MIGSALFHKFENYLKTLDALRAGTPPPLDDADLAPWSLEKARRSTEIDAHYRAFIEREEKASARMGELDAVPVPEDLDYAGLGGMLTESRQKLSRIRPRSLGQALRVPGVTPADIQVLHVHLRRLDRGSLN